MRLREVKMLVQSHTTGTSLVVQRLRLCASTAGGAGSIPGLGIKIPHAAWFSQRNKKNPKQTKKQSHTASERGSGSRQSQSLTVPYGAQDGLEPRGCGRRKVLGPVVQMAPAPPLGSRAQSW